MREHILVKISELPQEVDTVLVAMGFCGGSWQDVCCDKRLVIPRVDDCVTIAMTNSNAYNPCPKEPRHMYQFGDEDKDFTISRIYEGLFEKYDPEMAEIIFNVFFEHYYHLDIVDTGLYDCYDESFVARAQADADLFHAELGYVQGGNLLLEKLLTGQWDAQFFIVPPGKQITQGAFFEEDMPCG